jgi:hypothetical protein
LRPHRGRSRRAGRDKQQRRFPNGWLSDGVRAATKPQALPQVSSIRKLARRSSTHIRGRRGGLVCLNWPGAPVERESALMYIRGRPENTPKPAPNDLSASGTGSPFHDQRRRHKGEHCSSGCPGQARSPTSKLRTVSVWFSHSRSDYADLFCLVELGRNDAVKRLW